MFHHCNIGIHEWQQLAMYNYGGGYLIKSTFSEMTAEFRLVRCGQIQMCQFLMFHIVVDIM